MLRDMFHKNMTFACAHVMPSGKCKPQTQTLMQGLLELSEEQLQDLEMLRRIYLIKRAGLAKERKMLVHQAVRSLSHAEDTVPLPGHTRVSSRSALLHPHSHIQTDLCRITDLASLLVRVNADHVQGALRVSSHGCCQCYKAVDGRDPSEQRCKTFAIA